MHFIGLQRCNFLYWGFLWPHAPNDALGGSTYSCLDWMVKTTSCRLSVSMVTLSQKRAKLRLDTKVVYANWC